MVALAVVVVVVGLVLMIVGPVTVVVVVLVMLVVVFGSVDVVGFFVAVVVHIEHALQIGHVHFFDHGLEILVHQISHRFSVNMVAGVAVVVALEVTGTFFAELQLSHVWHPSHVHFSFHGSACFTHHLWHIGCGALKHVVVRMQHVSIIAKNNPV